MQLKGKAIEAFIKSPDPAAEVVLLYGPDQGKTEERVKTLAAHYGDAGDPLARLDLDGAEAAKDPATLMDEAFAMNLMGGDRVIVIKQAGNMLTEVIKDILAEDKPLAAKLVITAGELDTRSSLRRLCEKEKRAVALPAYKDTTYHISGLIASTLREKHIRAEREVVDYLAAQFGNDHLITRGELEKLLLYLGDRKELTLKEAQQAVGQNEEINADSLCFAIAEGNMTEIDKDYQRLLLLGTAPTAMLYAIARHFETLLSAQGLLRQGLPAREALRKAGVFIMHQERVTRQLGRWPEARLLEGLALLSEMERRQRSGIAAESLLMGPALFRLASLARKSQRQPATSNQ